MTKFDVDIEIRMNRDKDFVKQLKANRWCLMDLEEVQISPDHSSPFMIFAEYNVICEKKLYNIIIIRITHTHTDKKVLYTSIVQHFLTENEKSYQNQYYV